VSDLLINCQLGLVGTVKGRKKRMKGEQIKRAGEEERKGGRKGGRG
jgi:hypothetical protein